VKAYLALVEAGPSTATEVSRRSGIPYSKIYEVLRGLEAKGWIESEHTRPSRFYPRAPTSALEAMKMRWEDEWRKSEEHIIQELQPLYERRGARERPEIWIVRGAANIWMKVKETLEGCRSELMVALPLAVNELLAPAQGIVRELRDRGVTIKIMASSQAPPEVLEELTHWGEVRVRPRMFGGGVIADRREVVILLAGGREPTGLLAIWSEHEGLAAFAREYFEYLWRDSKPPALHR
jgi:sugar-specific transcriptional regulator TrmB